MLKVISTSRAMYCSIFEYKFICGFVQRHQNLAFLTCRTILPFRSCSSTNQDVQPNPSSKSQKAEYRPVDWLPFKWTRRPPKNWFSESGDYVQTLEHDPSWPKPDFEFSEELKTASDDIKYIFSLANGSKADIKEVVKRIYLKKVQRHPNDLESLEAKIALKTLQVRSLFDHSRVMKKEVVGSRIILHNVILQRNRMLKQLFRADSERFEWLTKELQLYYVPEQLGGVKERYCKKWDLRRLTKEYCENVIKAKKEAYHDELKQQQAEFLKEKEEILTWIEKEEKELEKLDIKEVF